MATLAIVSSYEALSMAMISKTLLVSMKDKHQSSGRR
jgi:hypothetical protein